MTGERITDGPRSRLTEVFHKISWSQDNETMTNGGVLAEKKAAQSEYLLGPSNGVGESCQTASINDELQFSKDKLDRLGLVDFRKCLFLR